ncbi:hypothetical protein ACOJBM_35130 [Rhizobium beringeri]
MAATLKAFAQLDASRRWNVVALGIVLGAMNASFYLAISRLPLATVGAIEFLGPIGLAAIAVRGPRNIAALLLAMGGMFLPDGGSVLGSAARLSVRLRQLRPVRALYRARPSSGGRGRR